MKIAGIILLTVGILTLVYQGFRYIQTWPGSSLGQLEIHYGLGEVFVPPLAGGLCLVAAVMTLAYHSRS